MKKIQPIQVYVVVSQGLGLMSLANWDEIGKLEAGVASQGVGSNKNVSGIN